MHRLYTYPALLVSVRAWRDAGTVEMRSATGTMRRGHRRFVAARVPRADSIAMYQAKYVVEVWIGRYSEPRKFSCQTRHTISSRSLREPFPDSPRTLGATDTCEANHSYLNANGAQPRCDSSEDAMGATEGPHCERRVSGKVPHATRT